MRRAVTIVFAAALPVAVAAGCADFGPTCNDLAADLAFCDVRPVELRCDELSATERSELEAEMIARGCGAVWVTDAETQQTRVDPRMCTAFGWDCPEASGPDHDFAPEATVVFVGGIDGRAEFDWNPRVIAEVERRTGARVVHAPLPPWSPVPTRAAALADALAQIDGPVNLICYAVSGLDCRFLVSPGGLYATEPARQAETAARVRSITTVATAHRGTEVATVALRALEGDRGDELLDVLLGDQAGSGARLPSEPVVRETLRGLGNGYAELFNAEVVDADGVYYQSFAGVSFILGQPWFPSDETVRRFCGQATDPLVRYDLGVRDFMSEPLLVSAPFAGRTLGSGGLTVVSPSDGQVSVDSARWGAFRGCLPADHYDVVGQLEDRGPDPITGFDAAGFYTAVVGDLAARGL